MHHLTGLLGAKVSTTPARCYLAVLVMACSGFVLTPAVAQDVADTIFVNANVITMNEAQPGAEAIAIKDGKILAVGSRRHVKRHMGDETVVRDPADVDLGSGYA